MSDVFSIFLIFDTVTEVSQVKMAYLIGQSALSN